MSPGAYAHDIWSHRSGDGHGFGWAATVAVLFFALAASSFAIDQIVTLCLR
jgi:hypothetical protein